MTGTLTRGLRATIQQLVRELGGETHSNMTRSTALPVMGIPNPRLAAAGAASRKFFKATQLRGAGSPITVMSEDEFFEMLADASDAD